MKSSSRIISKRQITLPVKIFSQLDLSQGDTLLMEVIENSIVMRKTQDVLDSLAGSVPVPTKYKNKALDTIIEEAKHEHFS